VRKAAATKVQSQVGLNVRVYSDARESGQTRGAIFQDLLNLIFPRSEELPDPAVEAKRAQRPSSTLEIMQRKLYAFSEEVDEKNKLKEYTENSLTACRMHRRLLAALGHFFTFK